MARSRKVWIIVTQDGDLGEGPWDEKQDAEDYLYNEVGVIAGLLQVSEASVDDIRKVAELSFDIQTSKKGYRAHL